MPQDRVLDCKKCEHYSYCDEACIYVEAIVNGKKHRVEPLVSNIIGDREPQGRSYNDVLAEHITDIQARIEYLMDIKDTRCRAIGAMLLSGIKRNDICNLISMSHRQLIRVINNNKQLNAIRRVKMS